LKGVTEFTHNPGLWY